MQIYHFKQRARKAGVFQISQKNIMNQIRTDFFPRFFSYLRARLGKVF